VSLVATVVCTLSRLSDRRPIWLPAGAERRLVRVQDDDLFGGIAMQQRRHKTASERAQYYRSPALPGAEILHARFISHRYCAHVHDSWTVAAVDEGAATFNLNGARHIAPAGTVFMIPPFAVHTGESASPHGYSYRVLYLEPLLYSTSTNLGALCPALRGSLPVVVRDETLSDRLTRLHRAIWQPGQSLEQGEALDAVVSALATVLSPSDASPPGGTNRGVRRAVDFIHEHWREDFTLGDLATAVGTSRFHLVRTFHAHVGVTPSGYRRALRTTAAQRLLRQGSTPGEAAASCGFYDQSHLTRSFRATTGVTPARYARA
jgi:AraC-like DNA-binding protein